MSFIKLKCITPHTGAYSFVHNRVLCNLNSTWNSSYLIDVAMTHGLGLAIHGHVSPKTHNLTFKS